MEDKTIIEKIEDLLAIMTKDGNQTITGISYHDKDHGEIKITRNGKF